MAENSRPWSPPQIIWSAILAIALWSALGFSWFGQGFNWMTQGRAMRMSESAVTESLAEICVAQAHGAPDAKAELARFAKVESWKQREFINTAKWAVMPGAESAQNGVASLCATKLSAT